VDFQLIESFLKKRFDIGGFRVENLAGDASDRKYYRVIFDNPIAGGAKTAVLMALAQPCTVGELPYLNLRKFLASAGLPVPDLYHADLATGLILIEDFGDVTLEDAVRNATAEETERLYRKAVDLMLRIQIEGTRARNESCIAFSLAFDVDKFMFEFNFFYEHAVLGYKAAKVLSADELLIMDGFRHISETLAEESKYLTHRDYHSRNLMVCDGELGLVDFQDARLGPLQYDLVSLLLDSYVAIPDSLISSLYEYYLSQLGDVFGVWPDRAHFDRVYSYMAVQRCIKAAGSFAYLDCVKMKNRYIKYFAPCLSRVAPAIAGIDELALFQETLSKYVEELL